MDLRGLLLVCILLFSYSRAIKEPYIAALIMAWMSYMNPHRVAGHWSFVYDKPIFFITALLAIILAVVALMSGRARMPKVGFIGFIFSAFIIWLGVTTLFSQYPDLATESYIKFLKISVTLFLTLLLIDDEKKLKYLIWTIFISIGFFGIKGGVFTLLTGGGYKVWGPPDSFIEGNNELALASIMIIPLGYFLYQSSNVKCVRYGLLLALLSMVVSIIGSYSRGALLALISVGIFLWIKSSNKLPVFAIMLLSVLVLVPFMPEQWFQRMETIQTYEQDASAMGRINAWHMAFNLARDHITGGGFETWNYEMFALYAPNPRLVLDAHSIYFEVLGEHGFPGLFLFLLLFIVGWFKAGTVRRHASKMDDMAWVVQLMSMCQVSFIAYASGGMFLGLAFWDLPYHLIVIILISNGVIVRKVLNDKRQFQTKGGYSGSGFEF